MQNFEETYKRILDNSFETNLTIARIALDALLGVLPNETAEEKSISHWIIAGLCFNIIASDGQINENEVKFFNELMSANYDEKTIKDRMGAFQNESQSLFETIRDYKDEIKDNFLILAMCFAAVDGSITEEELSVLRQINEESN